LGSSEEEDSPPHLSIQSSSLSLAGRLALRGLCVMPLTIKIKFLAVTQTSHAIVTPLSQTEKPTGNLNHRAHVFSFEVPAEDNFRIAEITSLDTRSK